MCHHSVKVLYSELNLRIAMIETASPTIAVAMGTVTELSEIKKIQEEKNKSIQDMSRPKYMI